MGLEQGPEAPAAPGTGHLAAGSQKFSRGARGRSEAIGEHSSLGAGLTYQLAQVIYRWSQYAVFKIPALQEIMEKGQCKLNR